MTHLAIKANIERYRSFAIKQNIARYSKLLQTAVDEGNRRTISALLAEEKAKLEALAPNGGNGERA